MQNKITGIPETPLIPLGARAFETEKIDVIIRDYKAVEMVAKIDYDFAKFNRIISGPTRDFFLCSHDSILSLYIR